MMTPPSLKRLLQYLQGVKTIAEFSSIKQKIFWQSLTAIAQNEGTLQELTIQLHNAILTYGSETPDNLECVDHLCVGEAGESIGPMFTNSGEMLDEIAWRLEDICLPAELAGKCPNITAEDWDSFTRLVTLLFSALTRKSHPH